MKKIIEASELPFGDKVYLKKDWMGWRVVAPNRDPETGKINWFNLLLGGKRGLNFLMIVAVIATLFYLGIDEILSSCGKLINSDPFEIISYP